MNNKIKYSNILNTNKINNNKIHKISKDILTKQLNKLNFPIKKNNNDNLIDNNITIKNSNIESLTNFYKNNINKKNNNYRMLLITKPLHNYNEYELKNSKKYLIDNTIKNILENNSNKFKLNINIAKINNNQTTSDIYLYNNFKKGSFFLKSYNLPPIIEYNIKNNNYHYKNKNK